MSLQSLSTMHQHVNEPNIRAQTPLHDGYKSKACLVLLQSSALPPHKHQLSANVQAYQASPRGSRMSRPSTKCGPA